MKNRTKLISILVGLSILIAAGCTGKKEDSSETRVDIAPPGTEVTTRSAEETETITEEFVTPEQIENYTIELNDDEVFEIN